MPATKPYKAIGAFVLAFLGALVATLQGRTDLDSMRLVDWFIIVASAVVSAGVVFGIQNPPSGA